MRGLHLRTAAAVDSVQTGHRARIAICSFYGFGERGVTKRTRDNALDDWALKFCALLRESIRSQAGCDWAVVCGSLDERSTEPGGDDSLELMLGYSAGGAAEGAAVRRAVSLCQLVFVCGFPLSKRDGVIELETGKWYRLSLSSS